MPHVNGREQEGSEEEKSKESKEVLGDDEVKEARKERVSFAAAASTKDRASPEPSPEESSRWPPPYPHHGLRHSMGPTMTHPPYYGYSHEPPYPGAWAHHPPPPHGPPDPYSRSRHPYPHPPSSPTRRAHSEGGSRDASPNSKGSPRASEEDRAVRAAYEEHGYPPHIPHIRPPPYAAYGMPPPYAYHPHYYEEHHMAHARMMEKEYAHMSRKRHSERDDRTPEDRSPKRVKTEEKGEGKEEEKPAAEEEKSTDEEKDKEEVGHDTAKEEEEEKPSEEGEEEETDREAEGQDGAKSSDSVGKDGKRIISPTSSLDGTHKGDDSTTPSIQHKLSQSSSGSFPPGEPRPSSSSYDPYYHPEVYPPYGSSRGAYPPYYHPMYAGYPPPPHYRDVPPPPGWEGYYDHPSAHYHPRAYPPPPRGSHPPPPYSPHAIQGSFEGSTTSSSAKATAEREYTKEEEDDSPRAGSSGELSLSPEEEDKIEVPKKIKSVSDWRAAAMATGMAPSANRCQPLQEPIPSKCWGTPECAEHIAIPDFHRLVNYPDYLIKNYPDYLRKTRPKSGKGSAAALSTDKEGCRHCVMCGKSRPCSAASGKPEPSTRVRCPKFAKADDDDDDASKGGTQHIIPRQNKGLCTACDIKVWVIHDSRIEIKWCKGCKNFRPWAAFGDKGMATKCVRCRERQREKYASQKDKLKAERQTKKTEKGDDEHEMVAAMGLQGLMASDIKSI